MSLKRVDEICEELKTTFSSVTEEQLDFFANELLKANRIFCDGLGRSGLYCRAFAMRLIQLGMSTFFVGDLETPPIGERDVLLICSGSGGSDTLLSHAECAKKNGAEVLIITCNGNTPLGELANYGITLSAPLKYDTSNSILPMGSLFEESANLFFENLVLELMNLKNETSETMFHRHANLE